MTDDERDSFNIEPAPEIAPAAATRPLLDRLRR
jgi:hypothetical protein